MRLPAAASSGTVRLPVAADKYYAADPAALRQQLEACLAAPALPVIGPCLQAAHRGRGGTARRLAGLIVGGQGRGDGCSIRSWRRCCAHCCALQQPALSWLNLGPIVAAPRLRTQLSPHPCAHGTLPPPAPLPAALDGLARCRTARCKTAAWWRRQPTACWPPSWGLAEAPAPAARRRPWQQQQHSCRRPAWCSLGPTTSQTCRPCV